MVSAQTLKILGASINVGYKAGFIPYKYEKADGRVTFDESWKAGVKYCGNILLMVLYEMFLVLKYVQTLQSPDSTEQQKVRGIFLSALYLSLNVNHWINIKHYGTYDFFNEFVETTTSLKKKTLVISKKDRETRELDAAYERSTGLLITFLWISCILSTALRALKVFTNPGSKEMPSSLSPRPENIPFVWKLILFALQLNFTGFQTYSLLLHGTIMCAYIFSVVPILAALKVQPKVVKVLNQRGLAKFLQRINSQLWIIQGKFNGMFKIWPLGFEFSCGMVAIVRLFLAISLGSAKDFVVSVSITCCLIMAFRCFAEVNDMSATILSTWKAIYFPKWFRKYRLACQPMSVSVGNFFFTDKRFVLTIVSILITNTTSLVFAFKGWGHE